VTEPDDSLYGSTGDKPLTVVHTTCGFYPELPGGVLQYFRYAPGLSERGVKTRVYTPLKPQHETDRETVNTIDVCRIQLEEGLTPHQQHKVLLDHAADDRELEGAAVLYHPWVINTETCKFLWQQRMSARRNAVFTSTMYPDDITLSAMRGLRQRTRHRLLYSPIRKIIVNTQELGRGLQADGVAPAKRFAKVPNGVDLKRFRPAGSSAGKLQLRRSLNLPEDAMVVLSVGSVVPRKGLDFLLEAWQHMTESDTEQRAILIVVGDKGMRPTFHSDSMRNTLGTFTERIDTMVDSLGDPSRVQFLPEVEKIEHYYQAADLFAFTSHQEGSPNSFLEAMACGLSCITTPFLGLPPDGEEFGRHGHEFVRCQRDAKSWAEQLRRLLTDEALRDSTGKAARQWMEQQQDWDVMLDKLATVMRSAADTGSR
jgi:glycosyltransferase involved in cell wall biosynthesis